jgi:23S rRNA pseudouridine1911/1915/1917 synthase
MSSELNILAETKHWIAVNKPAGLNVEQLWDYPSVEQNVRDYLSKNGRNPPYVGIVHRLDRPVSGVLLVAKKKSTLKALNEQFAQKSIAKMYWAITEATPEPAAALIRHYLLKDQLHKRALAFEEAVKKSIAATLDYRTIATHKSFACLEVSPHSGKFHQIRVQLAAIQCPILGDEKYGATVGDEPNCIALHARWLKFTDPATGLSQHIIADVPNRPNWQIWPLDNS